MDKPLTAKLLEIKELYDAQILSQEEYDQQRKLILSSNVPQPQTSPAGTFIGLEAGNEYGPANARFLLIEEIARGGMASIWKAKDIAESKRLGKKSIKALKFLHPDFAHSRAHLKKLQREADNAKKLRHPNIVAVYNFEQGPDGHLFLVMEYLEGRDLAEVLVDESEGNGLSWGRVQSLMTPVADALHYAHTEHNIIHRDIKPANIFLTGDNKIKVIDFGLAEELKLSGSQLGIQADERSGTKIYWAPEICQSAPLAVTRDVYAFTAVVYELLTEQPPFPEEIVCERKADTLPIKPEAINNFVWEELIKGLAFKPKDRAYNIKNFWSMFIDLEQEAIVLEQSKLITKLSKQKKFKDYSAEEFHPTKLIVVKTKDIATDKDTVLDQYIDNGDGTVSDTKNKLMWKKCSEGQRGKKCYGKEKLYSWHNAFEQFEKGVSYAGYDDWRMPTIDELKTLVARNSNGSMVIQNDVFPKLRGFIWSSSQCAGSVGHAWVVSLRYGQVGAYGKDNSRNVRLVRNE